MESEHLFVLDDDDDSFEIENEHRASFEALSRTTSSRGSGPGHGAKTKKRATAKVSSSGPAEVVFNGPYEVEFNRNTLGKSRTRRKLSGRLLGTFRNHWAEGLLYTYPTEKKLLLLHRDKNKEADFDIWKFTVQEEGVLFTRIERFENRGSILQIQGVLEVEKIDRPCELVVSFKKHEELDSFERDVSQWTRRHPLPLMPKRSFVHRLSNLKKSFTEMMRDPYAEILEGEDDPEQTYFCPDCQKHYGESKLKVQRDDHEVAFECPKGHEWEQQES